MPFISNNHQPSFMKRKYYPKPSNFTKKHINQLIEISKVFDMYHWINLMLIRDSLIARNQYLMDILKMSIFTDLKFKMNIPGKCQRSLSN